MRCWYSYSYRNDRYIFGQGDMTCLRSSKRTLKPSKTKYPLGKHPYNLMPYKIIPRYGLRARSSTWCTTTIVHKTIVYISEAPARQNAVIKNTTRWQVFFQVCIPVVCGLWYVLALKTARTTRNEYLCVPGILLVFHTKYDVYTSTSTSESCVVLLSNQ